MIVALPVNDPVEECTRTLLEYFKNAMPILKQLINDFPNPNEDLVYPALSISHDPAGGYTTLVPYLQAQDPIVGNSSTALWIVGQWDFKIQMDFWARNRIERDLLFSQFYSAFNPQIEPMGLSLQLSRYYNLWVRYDMSGYDHKDNEQASQRQEWRTMVSLLVHAKHALTQKQFMITKPINLNLGMT